MNNLNAEKITHILIKELQSQYDITGDLSEESDVMEYLDSLDVMTYLLFIEEEFNVKIEDDQIEKGEILVIEKTVKFILEQS